MLDDRTLEILKMKLLWLVLLLGCLCKQSDQKPTKTLKVSLYYESLCPDCTQFILHQLYPAYKKIGSHLRIDFVPYGNTEVSENGTFICQHGTRECAISKMEACGLVRNDDQDKLMEFVHCVEKKAVFNPNDLKDIAGCGTHLGVAGDILVKCALGPEGEKLFKKLKNKQERDAPNHKYVPWLMFNGQPHSEETQDEATEDFLKFACHMLDDKPDACSKMNEIPLSSWGRF